MNHSMKSSQDYNNIRQQFKSGDIITVKEVIGFSHNPTNQHNILIN